MPQQFGTPHYNTDINNIETIQRGAAHFYVKSNHDYTASVTDMLADLKWDTLAIRSQTQVSTTYCNNSCVQQLIFPRTISHWNKLNFDPKHKDLDQFKRQLLSSHLAAQI